MATSKIHFMGTVVFPKIFGDVNPEFFSNKAAAEVITNDSIRCWAGPREYSHFTINSETGEVSWATFPEVPVKEWTEDMVKTMPCFSAGKPGKAVIDEATIPSEFWRHNVRTVQNEHFFMHLVQDKSYDRFVRSVIDVSRRYNDVYVFDGEELTGAQLRGEGMERWTKGIINELDDQFYVRLAKIFFDATGVKANRVWLENVMKVAILETYSSELAVKTVRFVTLSDKANDIITDCDFDAEVWPVANSVVDQAISWMFEDILDAYKSLI